MLEQLFSSKTRVKILTVYMTDPNREYYVRELTRKLNERVNSVRRELINLARVGILVGTSRDRKKYYKINKENIIFPDLRNLVLKARLVPRDKFIRKIKALGRVKYAILTGVFTGIDNKVDMLIIGDISRPRLDKFMKVLKQDQGQDLNYTVMTSKEFKYRRDLDDRFLSSIFSNKYLVLVGDLKKETQKVK